MENAIAKVEGTPPHEYNPAGIFNFHQVRIATSMTDLSRTETVMCRDFVVNNSTMTLYSIHKPCDFNAYHMGIMKDLPFNGKVLEFRERNASRYTYEHRVCDSCESMHDSVVNGYKVLDSKTINVNRLDDAESHTLDPDAERENVWWKVDKEKATEILTKRRLRFEAKLSSSNENFVRESHTEYMYKKLLGEEQAALDEEIRSENQSIHEEVEAKNKSAMAKYNSKNWFTKLFTQKPEKIVEVYRENEKLEKLSEKKCKEVSKFINDFNERHGNKLDLTHVFNKFGKPE